MISFFLMGIVFGSGPCLASCGPVILSYIAGTRKNILGSLREYLLFSFSRITVYIILALAIFFLGRVVLDRLLANYSKYLSILAGFFIILTGIFIALGKTMALKIKGGLVLGVVMGLLPCGPLMALLSYIGLTAKTGIQALWQSVSFGAGTFISPLLLLVVFSGLIPRFLSEKKSIYLRIFNFICGTILIFLGINLLYGAF